MSEPPKAKRKGRLIIISALIFLVIASAAGIFLYNNYNRLISEALLKSFNSSLASDVYELKFEKLNVNFIEKSIRVYNVSLQPREKPLREYPYINSSFRLATEKLTLKNVDIYTLLKTNQLLLERISITKPDIELLLNGEKYTFLPFKDSTNITAPAGETKKKPIDSFMLQEFQLIDASIHVTNFKKDREFKIGGFNISLLDLKIHQDLAKDFVFFKRVDLSLGEFTGYLAHEAVKRAGFKDFKIGFDSLNLQMSLDTMIFHFNDFNVSLNKLDMQTRDSLAHFTMESFALSYKKKSIELHGLSFMPNISDAAMQNRFKYQHTQASGAVGALKVVNINFDSLIYYHGLFIDQITLDQVDVSIFKDNTKPTDPDHLPTYFGQQVNAIPLPLWIKKVTVTNVSLVNVERKRDSSYAKTVIRRGIAEVTNITNRSAKQPLTLTANAYLDDKVPVKLQLGFSYSKPEFTFVGKFEKFNLPDLNPVIQAYTPAKINVGTADEISFSGTVYRTNSMGTMKFLFHDLEIDLELHEKAKWKSSVIAFAANSYLTSSNPPPNAPPKVVQFHVDRDMHKGFINIIIKSALMGIKETLIMSKENRKAYKVAKKEFKKQKNQ